MTKPVDPLPKVPPFIEEKKRPTRHNPFDGRGIFSLLSLVISLGALSIALLGGAKLVIDVFSNEGGLTGSLNKLDLWFTKATVLGIAYLFGWLVATVSIRVYSNLVLPILIRYYIWACLIAVCGLYIKILLKLFGQSYPLQSYIAYVIIMAASLLVIVGLHLIIEGHDLRPYSIPLFLISLVQMGLIVYRYIFVPNPNPRYLFADLFFFVGMLATSGLMLAHTGILNPLRNGITSFFNRNSKIIRSDN